MGRNEMAKVLIAPIGAGRKNREYERATYRFPDNGKTYRTPFISAALCEHLKVDKIFMLGTNRSMWEEVYRYFGEIEKNQEREDGYYQLAEGIENGLENDDLAAVSEIIDQYLQKINPAASGGSHCRIIEYGLNEQELFHNFSVMMDLQKEIHEGDEIYLDITHSFRSIPLFMYVMMDFIQNLRTDEHIQLAGIYYGMFEANSDGLVPVVDLKPLFEINRWTIGVYDFINYGNVGTIAGLLKDERLKDTLMNISFVTNSNNVLELREYTDRLRDLLNNEWIEHGNRIFPFIRPQLKKFTDFFKGASNDAEFQFLLAKWFFQHHRYSNGYLCLEDAMISKLAYLYRKVDSLLDGRNIQVRKKIKKVFYQLENTEKPFYHEIQRTFIEISKIRNQIAHSGLNKDLSFKKIMNETGELLKRVENIFFTPQNEKLLNELIKRYPYSSLS